MKILIIRHGDPDYERDSLTEKGRREAAFLAERIAPMNVAAYYVSPLGRARETAEYTLKKAGRSAETLGWLREFDTRLVIGPDGNRRIAWDMLPQSWTAVPEFYDKDRWAEAPVMAEAGVGEAAEEVYRNLDELLAKRGYVREGNFYRAVAPNEDTIVLFCHFGVECVILSRLLGVSPVVLWHSFIAAPTSVTTLCTEERREGVAYFRVSSFGDVSHLYANGEPPAFAGRFRETFANSDQRMD